MKSALCIVLFVFYSICLYAQTEEHKTIEFEVDGGLSIDGKTTGDYTYCIHQDGKVLDSVYVKKTREFKLVLHKNEIITISYHKDGYPDRYIIVDTHYPNSKIPELVYELNYEIELNPKEARRKEKYKDHPVAILKYMKRGDVFDFSEKYHNEIHHVAHHAHRE
jgi:hypothetical protein